MAALARWAALALLCAPCAAHAENVGAWTEEIEGAARRFALPPAWIARVMKIESGGRTRHRGAPIRSRAGAIGLMQLMPATWAEMRTRLGLGNDPDDPHDNILAGAFYLRLMYDRFGYPGLFAAYNVGPARYAGVLAGRSSLPAETRAYLAAATCANGGQACQGPAGSLSQSVSISTVAVGVTSAAVRREAADPRRVLFFALNASATSSAKD